MQLRTFRIALCQFSNQNLHDICKTKQNMMDIAGSYIRRAAADGAKLVSLPEMFNTPYDKQYFGPYAEEILGPKDQKPTVNFLSDIAAETGIYLIGGSISELGDDGKIYNTSCIFGPDGELIDTYRKVHLFDVDIPGYYVYKESEVLSSGDKTVVFDAGGVKVGVAICYDLRFPELAMLMERQGVDLIVYPAAFSAITGPIHFSALGITRALDTQCYVALNSQSQNFNDPTAFKTWGHSQVINPNGLICAQSELGDAIVFHDLDLDFMEKQRTSFPFKEQRRADLYEILEKTLVKPKANKD